MMTNRITSTAASEITEAIIESHISGTVVTLEWTPEREAALRVECEDMVESVDWGSGFRYLNAAGGSPADEWAYDNTWLVCLDRKPLQREQDEMPRTTITIYEVTPRGLTQIADWMRAYYLDAVWDRFYTPDEIVAAVHGWATDAEASENGEIEMPASMSNTGQIAYLRPERVARVVAEQGVDAALDLPAEGE